MAVALGFLLLALALPASADFCVATYGSDDNPGTRARPFATLGRARDAIRGLRDRGGLPEGEVTVWLRGGTYALESTIVLDARDSGTKRSPIVYRAMDGEDVRLIGGKQVRHFYSVVDPAVLERIDPAARDHVMQADLKSRGIADFGNMTSRGFGRRIVPAGLEFFFDDKPMPLACWPNNDWAMIEDVPAGQDGGKFTYSGDRPSRWTKAKDIWMHGYWTWPWADSYEKIKSIDTSAHEIASEPPHGVYGYQKGKRYRVLNLLEELDQPGEWYLNRDTGILYFWPPSPASSSSAFVSIIEEPIIKLDGASYVTLRGLTFEFCRGAAVQIVGGTSNRVAGCSLRNIGTVAVDIQGGTNNGVRNCDISETGDTAILLSGGDRKTLTPAGNYVENCHIHRFARWDRTYRPAVLNNGVGNRVAHNLISDAPHSAIIQGGNEHVVEYNEISRVCLETGDAGAFYMGRDWTQRGNIVRYNYFHDMGSYDDKFSAHHFSETMAVYLDDWTSGTTVYGNVMYKANRALLLGGGRDNVIENNIFVDCKPSVHVDARGLGWAKNYFDGTTPTLFDRFNDVNADKPPYSTRYPQLATLLNDEPAVPKGNVIARNICVGGAWLALALEHQDAAKILDIRDNFTEGDPKFVDPANGDFRLQPDSPAWKIGFKQIPMPQIGLYVDEYRTTLPCAK